jgi:hypothetical protein
MRSAPAFWGKSLLLCAALCTLCLLASACSSESDVGSAADATGETSDAPVAEGEGSAPEGSAPEGAAPDRVDASADAPADAPVAAAEDADATVGPPADATVDATVSDVSSEGGPSEASAPDAEAGVAGPKLVQAGSTLSIDGITADGYVAYFDSSTQSYYATSIQGGAATLIYAVPATSYYSYALQMGESIFVFDVGSNSISRVTAWSSSMAQPLTLTTGGVAAYFFSAWASDDSSHLAYVQSSGNGTVGALYGVSGDGSNPTLLVDGIVTANTAGRCFPLLEFRGGYAVASYCSSTDAGATPTVEAFSIANGWAPAAIVPNAIFTHSAVSTPLYGFYFPFALDPDAGRVIAASANAGGILQVFPIDGGTPTPLDPGTPMTSSQSLAPGNSNPWYAVYTTDAGALDQAYADNPAPRTLVDGGVALFVAPSLDGTWMLVSSGSNARGLTDISVVSTVNPGPSQLVATTAQYGNLGIAASGRLGGGFTTDGKYAVVYTNLTENSGGGTIFYVRSMGVAPPYLARQLSNGYATDMQALVGSKVIVADNFQDTDGGAGSVATVDLDVVDPSGGDPPTAIVKGVSGNYVVSADRSNIVYLGAGSAPGIYVAAVP